jgi:hypothetical protein
VVGDINGDGARTTAPSSTVRPARPTLRSPTACSGSSPGASSGARACLTAQSGAIAARNSCRGPWQPSLDLQLNYRPAWAGLNRRLTVSLVTSKPAGRHGPAVPRVLESPRMGPDGAAQHHAPLGARLRPGGQSLPLHRERALRRHLGLHQRDPDALPGRNPASLHAGPEWIPGRLCGRVRRGTGRRRRGWRRTGRRRAPVPETSPTGSRPSSRTRSRRSWTSGRARLTDDQEARLKQVSDTVVARNSALAKSLQAEMAKMGANADGARMMTLIRPRMEEARKHTQAALDAAKAILTAEQWNYLPERIREPRGVLQGGSVPGHRKASRLGHPENCETCVCATPWRPLACSPLS